LPCPGEKSSLYMVNSLMGLIFLIPSSRKSSSYLRFNNEQKTFNSAVNPDVGISGV